MGSPRWGNGRRGRGWCAVGLPLLLKLLAAVLVVACIKPLRNAILYPVWPPQWRSVGSYTLISKHVRHFFYPMDLTPYTGPCDDVRERISHLGILEQAKSLNETFRIYKMSDWKEAEDKLRRVRDVGEMRVLRFFQPALTEVEQRALLRALFVVTSALEAYNVSYVVSEGTLIGLVRHSGLIPWDDDGDLIFNADQWVVARRVLSCIPGFQLKMSHDFLWKFFASDSPLWTGESVTRFPYVDLFPYVEDEEFLWPLVIWLKDEMLFPKDKVFPTKLANFENFRVRAPYDSVALIEHEFGDLRTCKARLFERREKRLTTSEERVSVDCKLLLELYPTMVEFEDWEEER